mgnify:CR=1 FL=1
MAKRYDIHKIVDGNPFKISNRNSNIKALQITNTTVNNHPTPGPVKIDLYVVKKPKTSNPHPNQIHYLVNGLEIPAGVVLELGEPDLPYITDRDLDIDLFIQSDQQDGALTVTIKQ